MNIFEKIKMLFKREEKTDIQKARELHVKLKKEWDKDRFVTGGRKIELMEIYPSRGGSLYYIHKNILDIVVVRQLELAKALQGISFNIDGDDLDKWIGEVRDANAHPDRHYLVDQKITDLDLRRKRLPQAKMFLAVALTLIYRHDENPYLWEPKIRDAKLREINKDPNLHAFFLSEGYAEARPSLKEESLADWSVRNLHDLQDLWAKEEMNKAASIG